MLGYVIKILLWLVLAVGLYGALSVSYTTITGTDPCPDVQGLPACFVVTVGYLMMVTSLVISNFGWKKRMFLSGWLVVFLIAVTGTLLEIMNGNTCPHSADGLPLCYVSLAFSILILMLNFVNQKIHYEKMG